MDEFDDHLYEKAKEVASQMGYVTMSALQLRMRIGYVRASRFVDRMIADGFCEKEPSTGTRRLIFSTDKTS